jgi:hypothetical protein
LLSMLGTARFSCRNPKMLWSGSSHFPKGLWYCARRCPADLGAQGDVSAVGARRRALDRDGASLDLACDLAVRRRDLVHSATQGPLRERWTVQGACGGADQGLGRRRWLRLLATIRHGTCRRPTAARQPSIGWPGLRFSTGKCADRDQRLAKHGAGMVNHPRAVLGLRPGSSSTLTLSEEFVQ